MDTFSNSTGSIGKKKVTLNQGALLLGIKADNGPAHGAYASHTICDGRKEVTASTSSQACAPI